MKKISFTELPLSPALQKAIADMGFEEASPIQSEAIPLLLGGRDLLGQAQTGTGKTAAFAIPVIENLDLSRKEIQALVLCPTRELAIQVTEEFRKFMKYIHHHSVVAVYGGQEMDRQLRALKRRPLVIVGTPGRLMDHMRRGSIDLGAVRQVVLDEADEMLDMGFRDDIETILSDVPEDRRTALFSATMSDDILKLSKKYMRDPQKIDVRGHRVSTPRIDQSYYEIPDKSRPEALARLLDFHGIRLALVFCNTRSQVDALVEILKTRGYFAEGLHGDMGQKQRDRVMGGFRKGTIDVLVATDVAGRGIDVNDIEAVFNYDLPRDDEDYIHRIGRTGRMGKTGKAFTFVSGRQLHHLKRIERVNGIVIRRGQVPSLGDLDETRIRGIREMAIRWAAEGSLGKHIALVESLMGDDLTAIDIAATLLKTTVEEKKAGFDAKADFSDVSEGPFLKKHGGVSGHSKRRGSPVKRGDGYKKPDHIGGKTGKGKKPGGSGTSRATLENRFFEKKARKASMDRKRTKR